MTHLRVDVNGRSNAHDGRSPEAIVVAGLREAKRKGYGGRSAAFDQGH